MLFVHWSKNDKCTEKRVKQGNDELNRSADRKV